MMTETPDWQALLERSRQEEDRSFLDEYFEELCQEETLVDDVKMRLLANSLANSPRNRDALLAKKDFLTSLLKADGIAAMVLYNFCIDNPKAAEYIVSQEELLANLIAKDSGTGLRLLGAINQELSEIPLPFFRKLVIDKGLLEPLLIDIAVPTDPYIFDNIDKIIATAETYTDLQTVGEAMAAISCNDNFNLETVKHIPASKSVAFGSILANLTMKVDEVDPVLENWPNCIDLILDLYKEADDKLKTLMAEQSDEEARDELFEKLMARNIPAAPACFLRNVARNPDRARELWDKGIGNLLEYISMADQEVYLQLFGHLSAVHFEPALVDDLLNSEDFRENGPEFMLACSRIAEGFAQDPEIAELNKDTIEQLEHEILEVLDTIPSSLPVTQPLWVKGTKALAQLSRFVPVNIDQIVNEAPDLEAVQANIAAIIRPERLEPVAEE